ncbi:hypothetical protein GCT13_19495 [Paraburkholderia sp. CNPSo 3157]|uniref:Uncharacterized protein n=1 Tax=Paraburkholderia franconis TaxID=2654983 RepID=A0A7X1NCI2_9BURK|nr:hypothetical protein [Paraburkholderia franconis]MPW19021.1 hypothetical protein [Paraburkholderia franconis]
MSFIVGIKGEKGRKETAILPPIGPATPVRNCFPAALLVAALRDASAHARRARAPDDVDACVVALRNFGSRRSACKRRHGRLHPQPPSGASPRPAGPAKMG